MTDSTTGKNNASILLDDFLDRAKELHAQAEDLKEQQAEIRSVVKELMAEMKSQGFDTKVLKLLVARAIETPEQKADRQEREKIFDVYASAVNLDD